MIQSLKQRKGSWNHVIVTLDRYSQVPSSSWGASFIMPSRYRYQRNQGIQLKWFQSESQATEEAADRDRQQGLNVVCEALAQYQYLGFKQRTDLMVACRIRERKESFTVLLCGTSGCGKSTLASLLGHRLGVTTVVSMDSVRHMMRGFVSEQENPLLWSSTYHTGEFLDQAKAYYKKKEGKQGTLHICTPSTGSLTPTDSGSLIELNLKNAVGNRIGSSSNCNVSISNGNVSISNGQCFDQQQCSPHVPLTFPRRRRRVPNVGSARVSKRGP